MSVWKSSAIKIYRAALCLVLLMWCWGMQVCAGPLAFWVPAHEAGFVYKRLPLIHGSPPPRQVYVWDRHRVNWQYLFEVGEHSWASKPDEVFSRASLYTICLLLNFLMFFKLVYGDFFSTGSWFKPVFLPLSAFIILVLSIFFPWSQRKGIFRLFGSIIAAPAGRVRFKEMFAADVLTSLVKVLVDFAFSACYFFSGEFYTDDLTLPGSDKRPGYFHCAGSVVYTRVVVPVIIVLPLWCRFMQCLRRYYDTKDRFPHLANAGKYGLAMVVVLFGAFSPSLSNVDGDVGIFQVRTLMGGWALDGGRL
jgi:hypothetical protein